VLEGKQRMLVPAWYHFLTGRLSVFKCPVTGAISFSSRVTSLFMA
jgi:hypothetical protein